MTTQNAYKCTQGTPCVHTYAHAYHTHDHITHVHTAHTHIAHSLTEPGAALHLSGCVCGTQACWSPEEASLSSLENLPMDSPGPQEWSQH